MRLLLFFIFLFWSISTYQPFLLINESVERYIIKPSGIGDLLETINNASPLSRGDNVFHGYTAVEILPSYQLQETEASCYIKGISVKVYLRYTMPSMHKSINDKKIRSIWGKFYPALYKHEKGHGKIAINSAEQLKNKLSNLPAYPNCDQLRNNIEAITQQVMGLSYNLQLRYDRVTNHGETQGAMLWKYLE